MSYKEALSGVSQEDLEKYATGIARMASLAEELQSQGFLPERFSPEPSRLHPTLEGKVRTESITIGGKSKEELLREPGRKNVNIGSYAKSMTDNPEFTTLPQPEARELVIAKVGDLVPSPKGTYATIGEIWARRDELGLEPVPAETAFHYLLQNADKLQPGDAIWMSMKTIAGRDGCPRVFAVGYDRDGLWLDGDWTKPSSHWGSGGRFAFGLPQVNKAA